MAVSVTSQLTKVDNNRATHTEVTKANLATISPSVSSPRRKKKSWKLSQHALVIEGVGERHSSGGGGVVLLSQHLPFQSAAFPVGKDQRVITIQFPLQCQWRLI